MPDAEPNLIQLIERFPDPASAREYLESVLWREGVVCPHCGTVNESTRLGGASGAKGQWKCRPCRRKFTVTVGTIFEDTHIPLHKWIVAMHLINANKKGISALSLSRMLGISYGCTWHLCHRIRFGMKNAAPIPLRGVIEVDETFVGGKAKNAHKSRGVPPKTAVLALVERGGDVRAKAITNVNEVTVVPILKEKMAKHTLLMTDEAQVYSSGSILNDGEHFGLHYTVNHSAGEYVRKYPDGWKAHTNTVESFNAMVKRCIVGAWHSVSRTHLDRYLDEISFRWNWRKVSDGARTEESMRQSTGKRLMYRTLVPRLAA